MSKPKRADDRRRTYHKVEVDTDKSATGQGHPLAIFNDRRGGLGKGKRAK